MTPIFSKAIHAMIRLHAVLVCLLLWAPAAGAQAGARIESVRLLETAGGADLEILSNAPLTWRAGEEDDGSLSIRLPDAFPGPGVSSFVPEAGLVSAVEVSTSRSAGSTDAARATDAAQATETRITIRPREKMSYSVNADGDRITVRLRYRSATPGGSGGDDRIGPGDVLNVDVFGFDDLDRQVRVSADGMISLPLLGALRVAGLSLQEAERRIARMLRERDLVRDPQVSVFVAEVVSRAVTVQGAVKSPGVYQLLGSPSLLDVIGQAGGMDERAGQSVLVLRDDSGGRQQKIEIAVERLVVEGDPEANIALQPGDVVVVALARTLRIYVSGAVERPGAVEYLSSEGITVLQAITAAGGPTNRANLKKTYILRRGADGEQTKIAVNVKKVQKGKAEDVLLQRNDTVVVGEWFF